MEPGTVIVRIKLRYDTIDIFVEKYAINVGRTAIFLPTKSTREVGSEVRFELRIANDKPALVGIGNVLAVRPFDAQRPTATFGMVVELTRITKDSRSIVQRMLDIRKLRGLDDMALPIPRSAEAAQRPVVESTGVQEIPLPLPLRDSAPIVAVASRPAMATIVQAARSLAASNERFFANDDHDILRTNVDVPSALALARKLAASSHGLDADLLALQQSISVPCAIDIDEASAQLAQVLGGVAVKHQQRSAGWAIPPRVAAVSANTLANTLPPTTRVPASDKSSAPAPAIRSKGPTSPPPPARARARTVAPEAVAAVPEAGAAVPVASAPEASALAPDAQLASPPAVADRSPGPSQAHERPEMVFDSEFQSPAAAELDDDFTSVPPPTAAPDEPTQIREPIPRPSAAVTMLISDDMDLAALAEHTDFSTLGPPAPVDVSAQEFVDDDEVKIEAVEIEADAADEWIQGQPTVMGALDASLSAGAYREPTLAPPPRAESEFDFTEIANTLRRRVSTAPPVQNRTFAHTLPASGRTNRHITSRHAAQPANQPLATPQAWSDDDASFDAAPPVTVLAPDISARLSAIDADDDSDFSLNEPLTNAEQPLMPSFQPAAAPPASPSLDDALLSMSNEDDDEDNDSEFFFAPPEHLPDDFSLDNPSITSAAPIVQADDDIPIEMDFEILAEFDDDGNQGS